MAADQKKPALKAVPPPPPRHPRRAELASAIQRYDAALRRMGEADAAGHRAEQYVAACRERLESAEAALVAAQTDAAVQTADAIRRNSSPDVIGLLSSARLDVEAARDALQAAESALADITDAAALPRVEVEAVTDQLNLAVVAVIGEPGHVAAMLKRARELQTQLVPLRLGLRWLLGNGFVPDKAMAEQVWRFLRGVDPADAMPGAPAWGAHPSSPEVVDWRAHPASLAWEEARKTLAADADTVLPGS